MNALAIIQSPEDFEKSITGELIPYTPPKKELSREDWLNAAAALIKVEVFDKVLSDDDWADGKPWPHPIKISVGFAPNTRTQSSILGVCCPPHMSEKGFSEIFITPHKACSLSILGTLVHEMIHGSDGCASGHKNWFAKVARLAGLTGPLTATSAGDDLLELFNQIVEALGEIPHAALNIDAKYTAPKDSPKAPKGSPITGPGVGGRKPQKGSRMIKVECSDCEFSFRTSQKNIDLITRPACPACIDGTIAAV